MRLRRLFGDHQEDEDRDRLAVRRIERNGVGQADECRDRLAQALDPAVWDGDLLAETGRAEPFAREQAVEHATAGQALIVLEQQPRLLEDALLARRLEVEDHVRRRKELADQIHVHDHPTRREGPTQGRLRTPRTASANLKRARIIDARIRASSTGWAAVFAPRHPAFPRQASTWRFSGSTLCAWMHSLCLTT